MTIERRLEVFGITLKKKRLPVGTVEVFRDMTWGNSGNGSSVVYEDISVESADNLHHRWGHYERMEYKGDVWNPKLEHVISYTKDGLNSVDMERGVFPGVKIVYKWSPTEATS